MAVGRKFAAAAALWGQNRSGEQIMAAGGHDACVALNWAAGWPAASVAASCKPHLHHTHTWLVHVTYPVGSNRDGC